MKSRHDDVREQLAALCHQQWMGWMECMTAVGHVDTQGRWVLPREAAERWRRQMQTPYADLPEQEKESERAAADRVLTLLVDALAGEYAAVPAHADVWQEQGRALTWQARLGAATVALDRVAHRLGVRDLHERARRLPCEEAQR